MKIVSSFILSLVILSCSQNKSHSNAVLKKLDKAWLDSIIKNSDSSYTKPYKRSDFVTAEFYLNKKDSSVCQVMKDSAGIIRQIIVAKKDIRSFFASYYSNGQLQAGLPLDEFGQYHGAAIYFYQDGMVESKGEYVHGVKNGQWKSYDANGGIISTDTYDKNGQIVK